jgi:hypothetical protein
MVELTNLDENSYFILRGETLSLLEDADFFKSWEDPICSNILNRLKELRKELELIELSSISNHNDRVGVINKTSGIIFRLESLKEKA